jgi:hypothetical protein
MKRSRLLAFAVTLALALDTTAPALDPPATHDPPAIQRYQQAIEWWKANLQNDHPIVSQEELNLLNSSLPGPPTPELRAALDKVRPYIDLLRAGGQSREYGLQLDRSAGMDLLLPHLGSLRQAARVMRIDAQVRMADGDAAGAIEALSAINGFARHVRQDDVLVSSLVSGAIVNLSDATMGEAIDRGLVDRELAGKLAESLEAMRGADPLRIANALLGEAELLRPTLEKAAGGEVSLESLLGPEGKANGGAPPTREQIEEQLASIHAVYEQAAKAIVNPDRDAARATITELERQAESGELGVLAKALVASLGRAADASWKIEDMIAARCRTLDDLRNGRVTPAEAANAAVAYLQAAELVESVSAEDQRLIEAVRLAGTSLDQQSLTRARRRIELLLPRLEAIFETAAASKRCDFSISSEPRPALLPKYLCGLRGALRILLAQSALQRLGRSDAQVGEGKAGPGEATGREAIAEESATREARPAIAGDISTAEPASREVESHAIATALRVVQHLSLDPAVGHSAVATAILGEAAAALAEATAEGRLSKEEVDRLAATRSTLDPSDPTGISRAIEADRARLLTVFGSLGPGKAERTAQIVRSRGDGLTQTLLFEQFRALVQGAGSDVPPVAVGPCRRWLDEATRTESLNGMYDLLSAGDAKSTYDLVLTTASTARESPTRAGQVWLGIFEGYQWADVLNLVELRQAASNAVREMGESLQPAASREGQGSATTESGSREVAPTPK